MVKKALIIFLCIIMLCSCTSDVTNNTEPKQNTLVTIKILRTTLRTRTEDMDLVIKELNEYLAEKIGVEISVEFADGTSIDNRFNDIMVSGEQLDLFITRGSHDYLKKPEYFMPLDDLLNKYGAGIKENLAQNFLDYGKVDGKLMGIVTLRDLASSKGFGYNAEIAGELNLDMNITDISQLTPVFEKVKAAGYTPISGFGLNSWDPLMDELGVLMNMGQSYKVVNLYETEEYKKQINLVHDWYEKGYILDDALTNRRSLLKERKIFGYSCISKPGYTNQETSLSGCEVGCVEFIPAFSHTRDIQQFMWMIPKTAKHPEKAMEFLSLLYSDPVVVNLLHYGIENTHYVFKDKEHDVIGYPEGMDANSPSSYDRNGSAYTWGNQTISHIWEPNPYDIWQQMRDFNKNIIFSYAMGFAYDNSTLQSEVVNCQAVVEKYTAGLQSGKLDPKTELPHFISELKSAGIDKIIAEKQRQLDIWFDAQGIHYE